MEGELAKVITSDGIELAGFFAYSKGETAILHIPGTGGDFYTHGFVEPLASAYKKIRFPFLLANNRGHDVFPDIRKHNPDGKIEWATIGSAYERFADSGKDIRAWIDFLERRGKTKIILQGYSYGANKAVSYAAKENDARVAGLIILSGANDTGLMQDLLGKEKYGLVCAQVKSKIAEGKGSELVPDELGVICKMSYATYSDYLADGGDGDILRYHDLSAKSWNVLGSVKVPILAIYGSKDKYMKPSAKAAADAIKLKATSAKSVETKIIGEAGHSFLGKEAELSGEISDWLEKNPDAKKEK